MMLLKNSTLRYLATALIVIFGLVTILFCVYFYYPSSRKLLLDVSVTIPFAEINRDIFHNEVAGGAINTTTESTSSLTRGAVNTTIASTSNLTSSSSLKVWLTDLREGSSWERGSFCDTYFVHTYSTSSEICSRVHCSGTPHSHQMGTCVINGLSIQPRSTKGTKRNGIVRDLSDSNSFWLTRDIADANLIPCPGADLTSVDKYMETDDYARTIVRTTVLGIPKGSCQRTFGGTTFFFVGMETHIYFKFMAWYNLHKSLLENSDNGSVTEYHIIRFPEGWDEFLFPEFERHLFPEVIPLNELGNEVVCFKKVVLSPWAYAASPFRCKMDKKIKLKCSSCVGRGLATDFKSFRERVLGACGLPVSREKNSNKSVVVIKRKPYARRKDDKTSKFKRVWENAEEFVTLLSKEIHTIEVTGVYAEELPICKQIELTYKADVLVGLHGAGLVHLWWMQEGSHVIEFMPSYEVGNAAFSVLSKLLGIAMHSISFKTSPHEAANVPIDRTIGEIKKLL